MNNSRNSITRLAHALLGLAMTLGIAAQAYAASIPVPNYSFEDPNLPTDPSAVIGDPPGWVGSGSVITDNPPEAAFTGALGSGTPTGGDQAQSLFLTQGSSVVSSAPLWTVQAGDVYTLTVAVGHRFDSSPGTAGIGFQLDDAFVPGGDSTFDMSSEPAGIFTDITWIYAAQPSDVGKSLKVYLGDSVVPQNFDNVRLEVVPEPGTLALLAFGLIGFGAIKRR